jgi:hypothetical protein
MNRFSKISIVVFLLFFIVFFIFQYSRDKVAELKKDLQENQKIYSRLLNEIRDTNFEKQCVKFSKMKELPINLETKINSLEISDQIESLVIIKDSLLNHIKLEITLQNNWHLDYSDFPNDFLNPNYYKKEDFVEIWSVGNNWVIWHDDDFI